jgi:hypothetical protein
LASFRLRPSLTSLPGRANTSRPAPRLFRRGRELPKHGLLLKDAPFEYPMSQGAIIYVDCAPTVYAKTADGSSTQYGGVLDTNEKGREQDWRPWPNVRYWRDSVAKVENRTTVKISRKLIFGLFCCCVAFERHYGGSWSILDEAIWSLTSPRVKRTAALGIFVRRPKRLLQQYRRMSRLASSATRLRCLTPSRTWGM